MSVNKLVFEGLDGLRQALRQLPAELAAEAGPIVERRAHNTAAAVRAEYAAHRVSGNLASRVTVSLEQPRFGASSTVRSAAPHAALFEFGTQLRRTASGAGRGSAPPHPTVIPIAIRERRAMTAELIELVKRAGFEVTGG